MSKNCLYSLYTITPMHCGSGQAMSAIDLPLIREAVTGFPFVPATSIKGVLRAEKAREKESEAKQWFGDADSASKLLFLDGKLLAYPVRSLNAVFYWVTCPLVMRRYKRDLEAFGLSAGDLQIPKTEEKALCSKKPAGKLVLEDLIFECEENGAVEKWAKAFAELLPEAEKLGKEMLGERLLILPDEDFTDLVQRTTPVQARIVISEATGTSDNLWYEETLPSDCLFYFVMMWEQRGRESEMPKFGPLIQLGGNKTVGQGFCRLQAYERRGDSQDSGVSAESRSN